MENGQRNAARQQRENAWQLRCLKARPQQRKTKRKAKQKRRRKSQQHGETAHDNSPVASQSKGPLPGRQEMENELDSAGGGCLAFGAQSAQHRTRPFAYASKVPAVGIGNAKGWDSIRGCCMFIQYPVKGRPRPGTYGSKPGGGDEEETGRVTTSGSQTPPRAVALTLEKPCRGRWAV